MRILFVSALLPLALACREKPVLPVGSPAPPAARVDAETVVAGKDPGAGRPENLVPEPEPEPALDPDAGPREDVKLSVRIGPVPSEIFWGVKRLGVSRPGEPFEILRPRGSGPVDLVLRAAGYLPYHLRLFTDREDALLVQLVRPQDAPSLNGWTPPKKAPTRGR